MLDLLTLHTSQFIRVRMRETGCLNLEITKN